MSVSMRHAARALGLSHTALQKAARSGRIAPEVDGGWDAAKVRAGLGETSDPARLTAAFAEPRRAAPSPSSMSRPAAAAAPPPDAGSSSFHNARTANEVLKAQERRIRLDERRGQLVDKNKAMLLMHRLAKEERDAILTWPARVAAELAAELGVDPHRLQTAMEVRLRQHLTDRMGTRPEAA